jgi:hypothetical protein
LNFPAPQSEQYEDPELPEKAPAPHSMQLVLPEILWNNPGAQSKQED